MFEFGIHSLCVHPEEQTELSAFPFQRFQMMLTRARAERVGRHQEVAPNGAGVSSCRNQKTRFMSADTVSQGQEHSVLHKETPNIAGNRTEGLLSRHFCKI